LRRGRLGWTRIITGVCEPFRIIVWPLTDNSNQVLTSIKTREPLQKNGAGSLILKWGLAQAAKEGVPAYLEAVVQAMHLYEMHGFREVGRHKINCTPYAMPGLEFEVARMRADP
jgi:predicted N-acetyltransferase YhbS